MKNSSKARDIGSLTIHWNISEIIYSKSFISKTKFDG